MRTCLLSGGRRGGMKRRLRGGFGAGVVSQAGRVVVRGRMSGLLGVRLLVFVLLQLVRACALVSAVRELALRSRLVSELCISIDVSSHFHILSPCIDR